MKGRPVLGVPGMTVRESPTQEEAVRYLPCHTGERRWVAWPRIPAEQDHSGPFTGSDCQSGVSGNFPEDVGVNARKKYRNIQVFLETGRFNRDLTCKNSGAVRATFFRA